MVSVRRVHRLGHGNSPQSHSFVGWQACYLAANDPMGELQHIVMSLLRANLVQIDRFISVVGSFTALNLLMVLQPRYMHFFDMNPCAIQWAQLLCELIAMSTSPAEFITRIFARDVATFELHTQERLSFLNQSKYMDMPPSMRVRDGTSARLTSHAHSVRGKLDQAG
eukprot:2464677-Amphidinium_carterae.1